MHSREYETLTIKFEGKACFYSTIDSAFSSFAMPSGRHEWNDEQTQQRESIKFVASKKEF